MSAYRISVGVLLLALIGCSAPEKQKIDRDHWIGLPEIAASCGGQVTNEPDTGKALLDAPGAQLVATAGLGTIVFNGTQYLLPEPAVIVDGELFLPRSVFNFVLAERFAAAAAASELAQLPPEPLPTQPEGPGTAPPPAVAGDLTGWRVAIDPGHGGKDPGAVVDGQLSEKELTTHVAQLVTSALQAMGATVVSTRSGDQYVGLDERVDAAVQGRCQVFVSIHANAFKDEGVRGVEVYHKSEPAGALVADSRSLAASLLASILRNTNAASRGVREDVRGLRVLRKAEMPAVLVEMGYITNADERARLADPAYQQAMATGIVEGLRDFAASRQATAMRSE